MTIEILGKKLDGDFYDADFIEKYEQGVRNLQKDTAECRARQHETTAQGYRELISIVDDFFDDVFGDGTAEMLFAGAEGNVRVHLEAVGELNDQAAVQKKGLNDLTNRYAQKTASAARPQQAPWPPEGGKRRRNR